LEDKSLVIKRLRKVEGQIKGIQKMVDEDKFCGDILIQIAAARSALNNAGGLILENYIKNCLSYNSENNYDNERIDELVKIMLSYTKQN